jgi:hypothetical protein
MNITKEKIERLVDTSQKLLGALKASPVWGMIENETIITEWNDSILEVTQELEMEKVKGVTVEAES